MPNNFNISPQAGNGSNARGLDAPLRLMVDFGASLEYTTGILLIGTLGWWTAHKSWRCCTKNEGINLLLDVCLGARTHVLGQVFGSPDECPGWHEVLFHSPCFHLPHLQHLHLPDSHPASQSSAQPWYNTIQSHGGTIYSNKKASCAKIKLIPYQMIKAAKHAHASLLLSIFILVRECHSSSCRSLVEAVLQQRVAYWNESLIRSLYGKQIISDSQQKQSLESPEISKCYIPIQRNPRLVEWVYLWVLECVR